MQLQCLKRIPTLIWYCMAEMKGHTNSTYAAILCIHVHGLHSIGLWWTTLLWWDRDLGNTAKLFWTMGKWMLLRFALKQIIHLQANNLEIKPLAPLHSYAAVSASNVLATTCQYEALKYVSFPLQTLGKCAKMIPVMIWGALILQKSYNAKDYSRALVVTAGCTLFLMSGEVQQSCLWLALRCYGAVTFPTHPRTGISGLGCFRKL